MFEYDYFCWHELADGRKTLTGYEAGAPEEAKKKCLEEHGHCLATVSTAWLMLNSMSGATKKNGGLG